MTSLGVAHRQTMPAQHFPSLRACGISSVAYCRDAETARLLGSGDTASRLAPIAVYLLAHIAGNMAVSTVAPVCEARRPTSLDQPSRPLPHSPCPSCALSAFKDQNRNVTTRPYPHRSDRRVPTVWRPADCIPDSPWSVSNWKYGSRPRRTCSLENTRIPSA
jgi:hypothetical protein